MKVGIYGQFYHQDAGKYIQELLDELDRAQIDVIIEENFLDIINHHETIKKEYNHFSTFEELDDSYDLFFSIGGDGTILKTIYYVRHHNIQKEEIKESISNILSGDYSISKRSVLQINSEQEPATINDFNFALNEIAVSRRNTTSMITVETWLNDNYLNAYWADGLIVSTPTGSTGYSLSCGGPVIMPDTQNFVLTPIAPHNLNARPLIIKDDTKIKLKVSTREDTFLVSMDSRIATLQKNSVLTVQKAPFQIHLVELNGSSFPKTLRKKLLWGQDKRN
jgi:NAD+ kinase